MWSGEYILCAWNHCVDTEERESLLLALLDHLNFLSKTNYERVMRSLYSYEKSFNLFNPSESNTMWIACEESHLIPPTLPSFTSFDVTLENNDFLHEECLWYCN